MLTHASYHFNSSVQRVIDQWQVSHALCNFGRKKKRDVRDDIKYAWTNLKIVRLGIARTHGWVELAPTVPTSSSHRSSTVHYYLEIITCAPSISTMDHPKFIVLNQKEESICMYGPGCEKTSCLDLQTQRRRPACASTQSDQRLCYSLNRKKHIKICYE